MMSYYYYDDICVLDLNGVPGEGKVMDTFFYCEDKEIALNGRDSCNLYFWDNGDTVQGRTINASGTYWVKSVEIANCNFSVDTYKVTELVRTLPIFLGGDTIICKGQSLLLDAFDERFDHYLWNTGAGSTSLAVQDPKYGHQLHPCGGLGKRQFLLL